MNPVIEKHIEDVIANIEEQSKLLIRNVSTLMRGHALLRKVEAPLADTAYINAYGGIFWFDVYNREDLQTLMVVAPKWDKTTEGDTIKYNAIVDGVSFRITAHDAALPGTCKLVEEEVVVPAVPERIEKRMVVKCNQPVAAPVELSPEELTHTPNEIPV